MRYIGLPEKVKHYFLAALDVRHKQGSENFARLKSTAIVRLEAYYLGLVKWGINPYYTNGGPLGTPEGDFL